MKALKLLLSFFVCLLPTWWMTGITLLFLHLGWFSESKDDGFSLLVWLALLVVSAFFQLLLVGALWEKLSLACEPEKPTAKKKPIDQEA